MRKSKAQSLLTIILAGLVLLSARMATAASHDLQVYFIDVDGGQSTLFVTPTGQSLLVDAGWPGSNAGNRAGRPGFMARSVRPVRVAESDREQG